jgi:ankyrin repeat protein
VNQNVVFVNNLIFAGANLEMQDADGNTPLMIGIKNTKLLLID